MNCCRKAELARDRRKRLVELNAEIRPRRVFKAVHFVLGVGGTVGSPVLDTSTTCAMTEQV